MLSREEVARRISRLPPERQAEAAKLALQLYGSGSTDASRAFAAFKRYQFDTAGYIEKHLGWRPWAGGEETPGQAEVIAAYELALRQQIEQQGYERGELQIDDLKAWQPGQVIQNRIRVEAGHTVGKTKLSSGLVNHFFDCYPPAIIYTFAPSWIQIHDLMWKEIKADRSGKGLPGRVLDLELNAGPDHFAKGRATNDAGGKGTERIHGQHGRHLMFVLDEAEGVADFVWGAVDSMMSGGICIMLMLANPRTRTSPFHKAKTRSSVRSFRISCINHPNVVQGREIVPGAVKRNYVEEMIEKHCEVVMAHDSDAETFELPFPVRVNGKELPAATVFKPSPEFMFRVLGIAPANISDNTLVTSGRFEAATKRPAPSEDVKRIRMGVDVARYGKDFGTLYARHNGRIWRARQFWKQDTSAYAGAIIDEALALGGTDKDRAGYSLHIRVDGGGGFGGGVIDQIKSDARLMAAFPDFKVLEVHFNSAASDTDAYADLITEMHAEAAETLKGIRVDDPPNELEADLTERAYKWVNQSGVSVKKLEPKDDFKKRVKRSPDDGDGFVLAAAPDHVFQDGGWANDTTTLLWLANRGKAKPDDQSK